MTENLTTIIKTLTSNDVGITGTHQSGIVIPRTGSMLTFFPSLDITEVNPRVLMAGIDAKDGASYQLNFIYYNGKIHGTSTRNEYRLTGVMPFLKAQDAQPGDQLQLNKIDDLSIELIFIKKDYIDVNDNDKSLKIILTGKWSTIRSKNK